MAQRDVAISLASTAFGICVACCRCQVKRQAENEETANWQVRPTNINCNCNYNWGVGLRYLRLRNVKGFG